MMDITNEEFAEIFEKNGVVMIDMEDLYKRGVIPFNKMDF